MDNKMKKMLEDTKIHYKSSNDGKEYVVSIDHVKAADEKSISGSDTFGRYVAVDLVTGEITKERIEDGIPQPYTAGKSTSESINMLKEILATEHEMGTKIEENNIEQMEVMKELMSLLKEQNMQEQMPDMKEMFQYMAGMQLQLGIMTEELHDVKKQLQALQESQPAIESKSLTDKVTQLEGKLHGLIERISEIKENLLDTASQAVTAFKEKGREEMNKVLQKGISGAKELMENCQERLIDVKTDYEKVANQIDSIGDELKQIGNSVANVGRLVSGKGTKEVSEEKQGVALTRILNAPVKKAISNFEKSITKFDKACEKLDKASESLQQGKKERTEDKKERSSIKDKLAQMKMKSEHQKKLPEQTKAPSKAECL